MNKEIFDRMQLKWPEKLLFIGSGITQLPSEWRNIESIRTNSKTLGCYPDVPLYGIMTWPETNTHEGISGVKENARYKKDFPYIFLFDLDASQKDVYKIYDADHRLFFIPTKERFEQEAFQDYVRFSKEAGCTPRNSTGFYIILWLLYAPVKEIYISGYDGHLMLEGQKEGEWDGTKRYYDIRGDQWVPYDNNEIMKTRLFGEKNDFFYHNLGSEWRAIECAIEKAEKRGVKVSVSKEMPNERKFATVQRLPFG